MTLQNLRDELGQQIDDAWNAWLTAQRLAANYREAVRFNTLTRDAYLEQFVLGERSLLDILDAESELYNSETELLTARNNVVVGAWRIYGITGRLLPSGAFRDGICTSRSTTGTPADRTGSRCP